MVARQRQGFRRRAYAQVPGSQFFCSGKSQSLFARVDFSPFGVPEEGRDAPLSISGSGCDRVLYPFPVNL